MTEIPGDLGDAQGDNDRSSLPSMHWDREGRPIGLERWRELLGRREGYCRVAATWLGDGPATVRVSTVWIGIDYGFGETARPLIYETMVFGGNLDGWQVRTADRTTAQAAHDEVVALVRADMEVSS